MQFLLSYSDHFSYEFHRAVFIEMLRIAAEVRVFPLMALVLKLSPYLPPLLGGLAIDDYRHEIHAVPYELQRGGADAVHQAERSRIATGCLPSRWFCHEPCGISGSQEIAL